MNPLLMPIALIILYFGIRARQVVVELSQIQNRIREQNGILLNQLLLECCANLLAQPLIIKIAARDDAYESHDEDPFDEDPATID